MTDSNLFLFLITLFGSIVASIISWILQKFKNVGFAKKAYFVRQIFQLFCNTEDTIDARMAMLRGIQRNRSGIIFAAVILFLELVFIYLLKEIGILLVLVLILFLVVITYIKYRLKKPQPYEFLLGTQGKMGFPHNKTWYDLSSYLATLFYLFIFNFAIFVGIGIIELPVSLSSSISYFFAVALVFLIPYLTMFFLILRYLSVSPEGIFDRISQKSDIVLKLTTYDAGYIREFGEEGVVRAIAPLLRIEWRGNTATTELISWRKIDRFSVRLRSRNLADAPHLAMEDR